MLARSFRDLDLAEDAAQQAFAEAVVTWKSIGIPRNPGAWITAVARRRAIDRVRRETTRDDKEDRAAQAGRTDRWPDFDLGGESVDDDVLRLVFMCCHPSLGAPTQVALTLRLVAGIETAAIARAFLVPEATLTQRIVRAKRKIRAANVPFRMPDDAQLPDRLGAVLAVIFLTYNEGYIATSGDGLDRRELCDEAIRLARLLARLMPDEPEIRGLLALMSFISARRPSRVADDGSFVPLADQDRSRWDQRRLDEARGILRGCLGENRAGPYQLHAAINAVHADARTFSETDWGQILTIYDQLLAVAPTPVVVLNRAVALAEIEGPASALVSIEHLELDGYHLWHAIRADLLRRCERHVEATREYDRAIETTDNPAEQRHLRRRQRELHARLEPGGTAGRMQE